MYHLVCPAKYRRIVFSSDVDKTLKEVCLAISERFESTVGQHGNENMIADYVKNQGNDEYRRLHRKEVSPNQISLFMD